MEFLLQKIKKVHIFCLWFVEVKQVSVHFKLGTLHKS